MLKKEYRTYLRFRVYILAQIADASKQVIGAHDGNDSYQNGQIHGLTLALEEHDRLFRAGQPV